MKIELPKKVLFIINNLQLAGYDAFAVGGCVRDSILARKPQDWDITTSAKPEAIKEIFRRTVDTGIEHGTVTVMIGKDSYEVTTYRIDGAYEDSRVGDPRERFSEDALRILRAVRFSAQLDFPIEPDTAKAVKELAPNLKNISAERIQTELVKLLTSPHPERIQDACELGITKVVLPEWDAMVGVKQNTIHHKYDVAEHTLHTLKHVKRDKYLRLTMLFHDMGKPAMKTTDEKGNDHFKGHALESEKIARTVLKRLKFDNETIRIVTKLVCYHDYRMEATPANVRRAMNRIGVELFPYYLAVRLADAKSQSTYMRREKIENIVAIRNLYKQILKENQCVTLRQLAVSGRELMELGMKPGRELGAMLSELLEYVLDDPERNTKENLCKYVREKIEKEK